jgi:hypothetical protein
MNRQQLSIPSAELKTTLLSRLRERVFHVSCEGSMAGIIADAAILPNREGERVSGFSSATHSYYRLRGCVCVFDYRAVSEETLLYSLEKCAPYDLAWSCDDRIVVYFLSARAIARLDKSATLSCGEMFVPHVEAGHPGPLSLTDVEEVLIVHLAREEHPFIDAFRRRRDRSL